MNITAQDIIESLPLRFRSEKAKDYKAVVHFVISGEQLYQYTIKIQDGLCKLTKGLNDVADCTITANEDDYVALETGLLNPQMAFLQGKIKVNNIAAVIQFTKCFRKFESDLPENKTEGFPYQSQIPSQKSGPLSGLKIIDFTRLLPGPLATMFLADMGADVIKVEDPDNPDYIRSFEPELNGISAYYLALNRSKRSLAVNYLTEPGKQVIFDLIKTADVLIEQFRPGVMNQLGLGYDELSNINPKLIYVAITGYGQDSSLALAAGHDVNYLAIAGALGITGDANAEPVIPGFQLADIAGGGYMAMNAVLAALYQREKTGKGDFVDVAMTDAVLPFAVLQFARYQSTKTVTPRGQFELSGGIANYNIYKCADGKYIALGSLEPKFWNRFCAKVGRNDWSEKLSAKGEESKKIKAEVNVLFKTKTSAEWSILLQTEDICFTVMNELSDLENDKYLNERKMFTENEHPVAGRFKTINQPLKFRSGELQNNRCAPDLGADTLAVLKEINYSDEQIADLRRKNIVKVR